ncbi:unnamed protein product, partial [marine sediment metagenome]
VSGEWMQPYLDEVESFPDGDLLDQGDATASGYNWLRSKSVGGAAPIGDARDRRRALLPDQYPEDFDIEPEDEERRPLDGLAARKRWHRGHTHRKW